MSLNCKSAVSTWVALGVVILLAGCNSSSGGGGTGSGGTGSGGSTNSLAALPIEHFFIGDDGNAGVPSSARQLWITDGTEDGTRMVKDIVPGGDPDMRQLTVADGRLFFTADDGGGTALWVSDGTEEGTVRVDMPEATGAPNRLTAKGNNLYFRATHQTKGIELWFSDGTSAGTEVVKDIYPGSHSYPDLLTPMDGRLYFSANDGVGSGSVGLNHQELWRTDGTEDGTEPVVFIQQGTGIGALYNDTAKDMVVMNDRLYFAAHDGDIGVELWASDGSLGDAQLVKEINEGDQDSLPRVFRVAGETLFFFASDEDRGEFDGLSFNLWKSNGNEAGTQRINVPNDDIAMLPGAEDPMIAVGDRVYLAVQNTAKRDGRALELWTTDGGDLEKVVAMEESVLAGPRIRWAAVGDDLYFIAYASEDETYRGIWKADGTDLTLVESFSGAAGGLPFIAGSDGETLLFQRQGEMWRTNGTESGTVLVKDICPSFCEGFIDAP